MNSIELGIIRELSEDARMPFRDIAKKLGISSQTVKAKYEELKNKGIIQRCSISIDLHKLGYQGSAHLLIKTDGKTSNLTEKLRSISNIIICTRTFGEYQVYAVLIFREVGDLYDKVLQIKKLPEVSTVDFSLAIPGMHFFPPKENITIELNENNKQSK